MYSKFLNKISLYFTFFRFISVFLILYFIRNNSKNNLASGIKKKSKKSVLILVDDFLPKINGGIYRPLGILKYNESFRQSIYLIASHESLSEKSAASHELLNEISSTKVIHYTQEYFSSFSYKLGSIFGPDYIKAFNMYYTAEKIIREKGVTTILASGPAFYNFIVALVLKQKFKVSIICDYRDEWSQNPFSFVKKGKFDTFLEKIICKHANAIVMTTQSQIEKSKEFNGGANFQDEKYFLIPNGIDIFSSSTENNENLYSKDFVNIVYAGVLGDFTSFNNFLEDLENFYQNNKYDMNAIRLHILGKISDHNLYLINNSYLSDIFILYGHVTLQTVKHHLEQADYSIMFLDHNFDRYIPGKIYDYIYSSKAILIYGGREESESIRLIPSFVPVMKIEIGKPELFKSIFSFAYKNDKTILTNARNKFLSDNSRITMANKFYRLFEKV